MGGTLQADAPEAVKPGLLWSIAWPIRGYVRHSPFQRGKGLLVRRLLLPILPPDPAVFEARLPGGGLIRLHPRETLGFATLLSGGFETAELWCAIELASPTMTAFDVGANVGIYSVALGMAIGSGGQVVALEPDRANVARLRDNLSLNSIENVRIVEAAAGERDEVVDLHLAYDPAYNSVLEIERGQASGDLTTVTSMRLDRIWEDLGCPAVSFVKIDVEGAELSVLRGARTMITATHPPILLEANDDSHLDALTSELEPLGYRRSARAGFEPWNHLFLWVVPT